MSGPDSNDRGRRRAPPLEAYAVLCLTFVLLACWGPANAQDIIVHGAGSSGQPAANERGEADRIIRTFSPEALRALAAPIALYPDDLLALVLPAATRPLQIVQASRFLSAQESRPQATPDEDWDPAVIALLNYPEALQQMNADLSWTRDLGEAVLNQQPELLAAITSFRQDAYAAGNLRSDYRLRVDRARGVVAIRPAHPQVLYVPYYDIQEVVVRQSRPVYHFYPRPYPVYYYPYASGYPFAQDDFWGVRRWYRIGWRERHLYLTRPRMDSLRYYSGRPPAFGERYRLPTPAYPGLPQRTRPAPGANRRHPGRALSTNPRHPGRELAINPRHPHRSFYTHGTKTRQGAPVHRQGRAPASAGSAPDASGPAASIRADR